MPIAHKFNPSNKENTCLWCGAPLKAQYNEEYEEIEQEVEARYGMPAYTSVRRQAIGKTFKGYGWEGNNFFCTLRCGEAFGKEMARNGRRFQPRTTKQE